MMYHKTKLLKYLLINFNIFHIPNIRVSAGFCIQTIFTAQGGFIRARKLDYDFTNYYRLRKINQFSPESFFYEYGKAWFLLLTK